MDQLSKEDLVLYLAGAYLSAPEKAEIEEKLKQSPLLQPELEKLRQRIDQFRQENESEREQILAHLEDYLDGKITTLNGIDFQQLLDEHPDCKRIYQMLQKELALDEAEKLNYPVSGQLAHRFDHLIPDDSASSPEPSPSLLAKVDALIERFVLEIVQPPDLAFLGSETAGAKQITTSGGNLEISVGEAGRVVKIFSMNDVVLDNQISDQTGKVVFKDFEPDTYKILVEGFEIKEVKLLP